MVPGRHEPRHGLTGICRTGECHCSADRVHRRSSPRCAVGAPRSVTYYTRNYFVCKLIGRLYRWYSLPDAWNINVWFRAVIVQKQGVKILDTTAWRRRSSLPVGTFRIFRPGVFPRNGILSSIRGRHVHGSGRNATAGNQSAGAKFLLLLFAFSLDPAGCFSGGQAGRISGTSRREDARVPPRAAPP